MLFTFCVASICFAEIVRSVEPSTGIVTYTSQYLFSDSQRNMHSISLVKSIKPLKNAINGETNIYFLLDFTMPNGNRFGSTFDIQVSPQYINSLPLAPVNFSSLSTAKTSHSDIPDMTKKALCSGKELLVRVNFSRGSSNFAIPTNVVQEWAELLDYPKDVNDGKKGQSTATQTKPPVTSSNNRPITNTQNMQIIGSGTGFFIDKDLIATNFHVISQAKAAFIVLSNGEIYEVGLAAHDTKSDLAILQTLSPINIRPLILGDATQIKSGEKVFTIGHPLTFQLSFNAKISEGIVNSLFGMQNDISSFQMSIPIQPGNSGGPMFNNQGKVIGITTSGLRGQNVENVNFAVKSNCLNILYQSIRSNNLIVTGNAYKVLDAQQIMEAYEKSVVCIILMS